MLSSAARGCLRHRLRFLFLAALGCLAPALLAAAPAVAAVPGWSPVASMHAARAEAMAASLPGGRVLVAGGVYFPESKAENEEALAGAEVYDQASGAWTPTGSLHEARGEATATPLPGGKVLVAGGSSDGSKGLATAEVYDPAAGTWTVTGPMHVPRLGATATPLPGGGVLLAGGATEFVTKTALGSAEVYDPLTNAWSPVAPMGSAHFLGTATPLPGGRVLVAGGLNAEGEAAKPSSEVYDPVLDAWTAGEMATPRAEAAAAPLPDGRVLVAGGLGEKGPSAPPIAEIYDPASNAWTATGATHTFRLLPTATPLPGGKVLVAGGEGIAGPSPGLTPLAGAEIYDPASNAWTAIGRMYDARAAATATPLPGGAVLLAGGASQIEPGIVTLDSAETYTPTSPPASPPVASVPPAKSPPARPGIARAARIARVKRGRALLRLRCPGPGGCRGLAKLTFRQKHGHLGEGHRGSRDERLARRRGKRGSGKAIMLGQARFSIAAGKRKTVRVKLSRRARALLRKAGERGLPAQLRGSGVKHRSVKLVPARRKRR